MMTSPSEPVPSVVRLSRGPAAFLDVGRGAPVVFVHGLPGRARDFRWLFAPMAGQVRLLAVDLPGFGQTPVATGPDASPEGRAAFVLELVDALGLERPVLVGHSMGGVVAVAAIAQRPARFSALGLISSPGLRPHAAYARVPRRALHLALRGPWAPLLLPLAQRLFAAAGFRGYPDSALVRTSACLRHTDLDAHAERLRRVALPTLAAWCQDQPLAAGFRTPLRCRGRASLTIAPSSASGTGSWFPGLKSLFFYRTVESREAQRNRRSEKRRAFSD